jgi:hypothetical protein
MAVLFVFHDCAGEGACGPRIRYQAQPRAAVPHEFSLLICHGVPAAGWAVANRDENLPSRTDGSGAGNKSRAGKM